MRLPRIDASRAIGAYAAVATLALAWTVLGGAAAPARFATIDVERINVREPDGTLRMTISGRGRFPGIIVGDKEYPHPTRREAGMIFFNDDGIETGGLVFDGRIVDGRAVGGGSLTFDRYLQDQTVQMTSLEDGAMRSAGVIVTDRPDRPLDFTAATRLRAMAPGPARDAAYAAAGFGGARRAWLGRSERGASQLLLNDGAGKPRLRLEVGQDGAATIAFLDAAGRVTRRIGAE